MVAVEIATRAVGGAEAMRAAAVRAAIQGTCIGIDCYKMLDHWRWGCRCCNRRQLNKTSAIQ